MIRKTLAIAFLSLFVLFSSLSTTAQPQHGDRITEDDPRWDCRTMGNKICGDTEKKQTYLCSAVTKKGTLCKRKVKHAGERCWQHKGK